MYGFYKIADLYISAFSYPGSSVSSLEAMSCSLPIITTAQPWLVADQKNGLFLKDNSPETISAAVLRMVKDNDLKRMGENSKTVVQVYDWETIAQKANHLYNTLS